MAWHPPTPSQVVDAGEQFASDVVDTVVSTTDAVVTAGTDAAGDAGNGPSVTHTVTHFAGEVAVSVATVVGVAENSIGTTADAVAAIAASILPVVLSVMSPKTEIFSAVRFNIDIWRYLVDSQLAKGFEELGRLRQQMGSVDGKLRQLREEIRRLQRAEQDAQDRVKESQECHRNILANVEKAANALSVLLTVVSGSKQDSSPDDDHGKAADHLEKLEHAVARLVRHMERRADYSMHSPMAIESLHRLKGQIPRTRHGLALAVQKRAWVRDFVNLKQISIPTAKPLHIPGR